MELPPGQFELNEFPRFGLSQFARRFPKETRRIQVKVGGDVEQPMVVGAEMRELPSVTQQSDFHCVTTWTHRSVRWSGFRFRDFYERIVVPRASPRDGATLVILRGQDGYATSLPLEDLLKPDVLLAARLNGAALSVAHGAPLRLVAPAHYGYKNAKHLSAVDFWLDDRNYQPAGFRFMDHPRARVALEERGRGIPGPILRYVYRPLVRPTIRRFRKALAEHEARSRERA